LKQPTKDEILKKLEMILFQVSTREEIADWAMGHIKDDNLVDHLPTKTAYWCATICSNKKDDALFNGYVDMIKLMPDGPAKSMALSKFVIK
jgi:hypothetical protein